VVVAVGDEEHVVDDHLGAAFPDLMHAWIEGRAGSRRRLSGGWLDAGGSVWPMEGWTGVDSEGRRDLGGRWLAGGGMGSRRPEILEGKVRRRSVDRDLVGGVELRPRRLELRPSRAVICKG
jgi:hypothetical protein